MAKFTNARERLSGVGGVFAPRVKPHIVSILRANAWSYLFAIRSGGELPECYDDVSIAICREKIYEYAYMRYRSVA